MRIVICDDHPVFLDGLALLLTELGHDVVATAASGEEAVEAVRTHAPDLAIMDLHLPGMSGVDATRILTRQSPEVSVLVLTMLDDDATVVAAVHAGAHGYLLKGAQREEIERALRSVVEGDLVVSGRVAEALRTGLRGSSEVFPELARREVEVLEMMSRGRTNEQIAAALFLSVKTVRNNVSAVLSKLGVGSRAEAVARARDAGLGSGR